MRMLPQFAYLFLMDLTRIRFSTFDQYEQKEPGFADAMLQAYIWALQTTSQQALDHDFIKKINQIAMSHQGHAGRYKTIANTYTVYFSQCGEQHIFNYSATKQGVIEFLSYWRKKTPTMHIIQFKSKKNPNKSYFIDETHGKLVCLDMKGNLVLTETFESLQANPDNECIVHTGLCLNPQNLHAYTEASMQQIFEDYTREIKAANTNTDKITVIAKQVQRIAQVHPFSDGNIRTCYIVLNKLLKDHDLPFSILLDPNRLDCCDLEQVVSMIKEGQKIYLNVLKHTNPEVFECQTSDSIFQTQQLPGYAIASVYLESFLNAVTMSAKSPSMFNLFRASPVQVFDLPYDKNKKSHSIIMKHIQAGHYETALRNACVFGECMFIHLLLDHFPSIQLNGKTSQGKTAMDLLPTQDTEALLNVKQRLSLLGAATSEQMQLGRTV